jgi:hypothetical protein
MRKVPAVHSSGFLCGPTPSDDSLLQSYNSYIFRVAQRFLVVELGGGVSHQIDPPPFLRSVG